MKIVVMGPTTTSALRSSLALKLTGAPAATAQSPVATLAAALRSHGHDIHILTLDPSIRESLSFSEGKVGVTFCPLRGSPNFRARSRALDLFKKEVAELERAIRAIAPDIVHAHWTYEYAEAAVRSGFPHLVTMHDLGWNTFWLLRDPYRFMRLIMKFRTMPRISRLSVVAPFMASKTWMYGYFGSIEIIPNGVDLPPLEQSKPFDKIRKKMILASVGDPGRLKNIHKSVEAFRLIAKRVPAAELHLFGPGLDRNFCRDESGVVGHGQVPPTELMTFLEHEATVLVHPSLLECCPVIVAEAKARGVPVVGGYSSGGVPFVCGGHDGGSRLVDVRNESEIADAVCELVASEAVYVDAARLARSDIEARFSIEVVTQSYLREYDRVIDLAR